jgi:endonuclease/exonuclease/phosphatase family metal-dependent hydrolase
VGYTLRVASYNLRDFKDDADAAARVVRAIDPDVLCLQEVPRHLLSSYRIASFATRCGLYWSGSHGGSGGTTVMSSLRLDVANVAHVPLKVARLQRERGYAVSRVRLPGHQCVDLVSLHLSLDPEERVRHAAAVMQAHPGDGALVLAGDLNEGAEGRAWKVIAGRLRAVTGEAPTFPAGNPRHRFDVIFASPNVSVVPSGAIELDHADLVAATDHLPVWVDLDVSCEALG